MKTNINILAFLLLSGFAFLTSCSDDEDSVSSDFSSFKWYTTGDRTTYHESERQINLNTYIGFFDISHNPITRSWTIPTSSKLLSKEFTERDSVYTKFIIGSAPESLDEELINVLFPEAGVHEVILTDTFGHEVPESTQVGGVWEISQIFTIDVFADPSPAAKVYRQNFITDPANPTGPQIVDESNPYSEVLSITEDNMPLESEKSSWLEIEIEAGEKLMFEDLSTVGRVDAVKWYNEGGKPEVSSKEISEIFYNKLGDYTVYFESSRTDDAGPKKSVSKLIPLKIKVIASTKPYQSNNDFKMTSDGVISFSVTGETEAISGQTDKFIVNVKNDEAGFDQNINVATVSVNTTDATLIELTLSEPVFNSDEITVSYAGGNITSVDARVLGDFGPENVKIDLGASILNPTWAGVEDIKEGNWKSAFANGWWVGPSNGDESSQFFARTTDMAFAGTASMSYTSTSGVTDVTLQGSNFAKPSGYDAGDYSVSFMIFLEEGNTMETITTVIQAPFQLIEWDLTAVERGKWVEMSQIITTAELPKNKRFDFKIEQSKNVGVTGPQKFYFDDLKWVKLNAR